MKNDFVSKFGMNSSCINLIDIDGEKIIFNNRYGHLFIKNYLNNIEKIPEFKDSKLYHYTKKKHLIIPLILFSLKIYR